MRQSCSLIDWQSKQSFTTTKTLTRWHVRKFANKPILDGIIPVNLFLSRCRLANKWRCKRWNEVMICCLPDRLIIQQSLTRSYQIKWHWHVPKFVSEQISDGMVPFNLLLNRDNPPRSTLVMPSAATNGNGNNSLSQACLIHWLANGNKKMTRTVLCQQIRFWRHGSRQGIVGQTQSNLGRITRKSKWLAHSPDLAVFPCKTF